MPKRKDKTIQCPWCDKGVRKDTRRECNVCDGLGNYTMTEHNRAKDVPKKKPSN